MGFSWVPGNHNCNLIGVSLTKPAEVLFIDTSSPQNWAKHRIPKAVHLTFYRLSEPGIKRFTKKTLLSVADNSTPIVLYEDDGFSGAWEAAYAVNWGFERVYHFKGGTQAWKDAGYPVEMGPPN